MANDGSVIRSSGFHLRINTPAHIAPSTAMKIVYVHPDRVETANAFQLRCAIPTRAINRTGRHAAVLLRDKDFAANTVHTRRLCESADIIIIQRNLYGSILTAAKHWIERHKTVVADIDEAFQFLSPGNDDYLLWHLGWAKQSNLISGKIEPPPLAQFKQGLRQVHAATTPSQRLVDDWSKYTNVYFLPNYIDLNFYENILSERGDDIVIGWSGVPASRKAIVFGGVGQALNSVCRSRPRVKVLLCGGSQDTANWMKLPPRQLIYQPWVSYQEWGCVLSRFDIGIAPLDGPYDDRLSSIRVLEYMVMKIPWLASDGPAYRDLQRYGRLIENTPEAWECALFDMVDHLDDYRQEAAGAPYLFAVGQSIDENVDRILNIYASIHHRAGWGKQRISGL